MILHARFISYFIKYVHNMNFEFSDHPFFLFICVMFGMAAGRPFPQSPPPMANIMREGQMPHTIPCPKNIDRLQWNWVSWVNTTKWGPKKKQQQICTRAFIYDETAWTLFSSRCIRCAPVKALENICEWNGVWMVDTRLAFRIHHIHTPASSRFLTDAARCSSAIGMDCERALRWMRT